eukprot:g19382.t1
MPSLCKAHICGRLLNENDLPIKAVEIFRSIPPGLAVPGISVLALKALQRAESDCNIYMLMLQRLHKQVGELSRQLCRKQRRGCRGTGDGVRCTASDGKGTQPSSFEPSELFLSSVLLHRCHELTYSSLANSDRLYLWVLLCQLCCHQEKPGELSLTFLCKNGQQKRSFPAGLTGEELKEQLREPLGLTAETPLALSYQNGSRNSVKKVLEEKQGLAEQGVEDFSFV